MIIYDLLSMEPWAGTKKLLVSVVVPPAPVRVSIQRPLAPSVASVTSVNNEGDIEIISGLCTDFLAYTLRLRKTPENLS